MQAACRRSEGLQGAHLGVIEGAGESTKLEGLNGVSRPCMGAQASLTWPSDWLCINDHQAAMLRANSATVQRLAAAPAPLAGTARGLCSCIRMVMA